MKDYLFKFEIKENQNIDKIINMIDGFGKIINAEILLFDNTGSTIDPRLEKLTPGNYEIGIIINE